MLNGRGLVLDEKRLKIAQHRRRLNKWRIGKEGPCLANKGRHDEAQR